MTETTTQTAALPTYEERKVRIEDSIRAALVKVGQACEVKPGNHGCDVHLDGYKFYVSIEAYNHSDHWQKAPHALRPVVTVGKSRFTTHGDGDESLNYDGIAKALIKRAARARRADANAEARAAERRENERLEAALAARFPQTLFRVQHYGGKLYLHMADAGIHSGREVTQEQAERLLTVAVELFPPKA